MHQACSHYTSVAQYFPYKPPMCKFARTIYKPRVTQLYTFGCTACVLLQELQEKMNIKIWNQRCNIVTYNGPSPSHSDYSPSSAVDTFSSFWIFWNNESNVQARKAKSEWQLKTRLNAVSGNHCKIVNFIIELNIKPTISSQVKRTHEQYAIICTWWKADIQTYNCPNELLLDFSEADLIALSEVRNSQFPSWT